MALNAEINPARRIRSWKSTPLLCARSRLFSLARVQGWERAALGSSLVRRSRRSSCPCFSADLGALYIARLRVPDSTRHSLTDFPHYWRHKHTVARKIEWAALPMLVYLCIRAWSITPRAPPGLSPTRSPCHCTSLHKTTCQVRSPIVGGRVERLSKTHARERADAERGTPLPPSKHPSVLDVFSASRYSLNSHSSDAGSQGKKGQPRGVLSLPLLPFHSHSTRTSAPAAASLFTPSSVRAPSSTSTMIHVGFTSPQTWRPFLVLSYSIGLSWIHI
ncbi:hypothetical protein B0H13DRAFT_2512082 [Mycena leptocephala]|nr:hypothetical protein B0H13DRAFT_2512082 [Mycena leptocephala]